MWRPEERIMPWTSSLDDLEFWPPLADRGKWKSGKLSNADLMELRLRFPDLKKKLGNIDMFEDLHLCLGSWLIYRDFLRGVVATTQIPHFCSPHAVNAFALGVSSEVLHMSSEILKGLWRRHGLLGIPVIAGGHWTLLVLRRSGDVKKVRYFDSNSKIHSATLAAARKILHLLEPAMKFPARRNMAIQADGISCGLYVLHYWEGEVRQFVGEGWSVGKPTMNGQIKKIRDRLIIVTGNIAESFDKVFKDPKKKVGVDPETEMEGAPMLPAAEKIMEYLKQQAELSHGAGLVDFYGCSKCRWSRGGCIWWRCNPAKFKTHFEKFPEKYDKDGDAELKFKELTLEAERKLTVPELVGGGGKVIVPPFRFSSMSSGAFLSYPHDAW